MEDFSNVDLDLSVMPAWVQNDLGIGGLIGEAESSFASMPNYEDIHRDELIPESKWKDLCGQHSEELRSGVKQIRDQGREPSCTSFAIIGAMQFRAYWQYGESLRRMLSPVSLYHRIKLPRGGSFISEGMQKAHADGVLPLDNAQNKADFKHTHPERGQDIRLPSGWRETAKFFKAEYSKVNSVEGWFSALMGTRPIIGGRKGHAIYYPMPVYKGNDLFFSYANSWRPTWGDRGFGYDSRRLISSMTGFVVESVTVRDEVEPVELA